MADLRTLSPKLSALRNIFESLLTVSLSPLTATAVKKGGQGHCLDYCDSSGTRGQCVILNVEKTLRTCNGI